VERERDLDFEPFRFPLLADLDRDAECFLSALGRFAVSVRPEDFFFPAEAFFALPAILCLAGVVVF
jgi:hypothetical protein